jgi:ATP-dependent Clp protease, protease subunit
VNGVKMISLTFKGSNLPSKKKIVLDPHILLDRSIDLYNRTIYLDEEITLYSGTQFYQKVNYLFQATQDNKSPITLIISTPGGESFGTLGLVDVFESLPTKVNTYCIGGAFSAGSLILACGTGTRSITKNSTVMVHRIQALDEGLTKPQIKAQKVVSDIMDRKLFELLGQKTKQKASFWKKATESTDAFFSADAALKYGIVDIIV